MSPLLLLILSSGCLRSKTGQQVWPDLAGCVDAFGEDEDSSVDSILHGDDLALAVAECEVVVEEPAAELVGPHGLRQDLAEGAGCEVSFCCFDGLAEGFDFCFCLGACCSFFLEAHKRVDHDVRVGEHVFDGGVHAVFADGWQDFVDYPGFELFGCGEFGVEDQSVEVAFGDEACLLCASEVVDDGVPVRLSGRCIRG